MQHKEIFEQVLECLKSNDTIKLKEILNEMHAYDQAQVLIMLDEEYRKKFAQHLSDEEMADIIQELEIEDQKIIIEELGVERYSKILVEMPSDDVADLLSELDEEDQKEFFDLLDDEESVEMRELMRYPENSAGGIMTTEYISLQENITAAEAIDILREIAPEAETVYYLYVVDGQEKLIGVLSLRDLIIALPKTKIHDIMYERVVSVPVDMDQEEVARVIDKYNFLAVPVVDHNQKMIGIITVDDAMDVLEDEVSEDIAKFGGISGREPGLLDLTVSSFAAAKKRIPWLSLLLVIGIFSGSIIAYFEETLEAVVILAVFIPVIAGMAGNTGTQSLAVVVRGLAVGHFTGKDAFRLIKREAGVGLLVASTNGILISLIAAIWQQNIMLGFVVGLALFITLFFATLAGTIIPLIMSKLKIDPAVASGPFITTINDILGLTIYFATATAFMQYLIK